MTGRNALFLAVLLGCADEVKLTQVVITVDSDLSVPAEIDNVTLEVVGLVRAMSANADLTTRGFPRSLSLVHDGGTYGPLVVAVEGRLGTSVVVERTAEFAFERERTLALLVELASACVGHSCTGTDTCIAGTCTSRAVGPLPRFDGVIQGGVFATAPPSAGSGGTGGGADASSGLSDGGVMP